MTKTQSWEITTNDISLFRHLDLYFPHLSTTYCIPANVNFTTDARISPTTCPYKRKSKEAHNQNMAEFATRLRVFQGHGIEFRPSSFRCKSLWSVLGRFCDHHVQWGDDSNPPWGSIPIPIPFPPQKKAAPCFWTSHVSREEATWPWFFTLPPLKNDGLSSSVGMMTFPRWWESH